MAIMATHVVPPLVYNVLSKLGKSVITTTIKLARDPARLAQVLRAALA